MLAGLRGGLAATAALLVLTLTGSRCRAEDVHPSLKDSVCPVNCNFENDLCGWEQLIQDSFDWTRHSGPTPSDLTGPDQDHTTGAGFYMYIEGNSVTHGDSARLLSSSCLYNGPLCLEFWYHMFGSATAMALNIYLLKDNRATKVWSAKNNRGPMWHQAQIDIGATAPFKIIVEAIRGSNAESDVAIDDISIHAGSCTAMAVESWLPTTPADVPPSRLVCNAECNFDRHLCSWSQTVTDAFDWTWQSGSTPTPMTGPSADHTGGGRYLYIEASSVTHGDTARLISAECSNSGPKCLQFWYHMYGSADTMGLHVYLVQNNLARNVWRMTNDQGNMWRLAEVELTTTGVFQIIFEGRRGSNEESDVAIDDVKLYHGECADLNKPTPAATTSMPTSTEATVEPTIATTSAQPETTTGATQPLTTAEPATTGATQAQTTAEPATTAEPTTTGTGTPRPPTTAEPATTAEPTTTGAPRPPTTAEPATTAEPTTTGAPRPPTTAEPATTAEPTTTGAPRPPTTAEPATTAEPTTTGAPRPPTTAEPATTAEPTTTGAPRPPTTAEPATTAEPTTTGAPRPPTTAEPATTAEPTTTGAPRPPTTAEPATTAEPTTTGAPRPPTTAEPATTAEPTTTGAPRPPTTAEPATTAEPTTTGAPRPPTTAEPATTAEPTTTGAPHPPTTAEPATTAEPTTTGAPRPPTTAEPATTAEPTTTGAPRPPTTAEPATTAEPTTTGAPRPPTTAEPATTAEPTTTGAPRPPTTAEPATTAPLCPPNSHYSPCVPACTPTCTHLNGPPHCVQIEACNPGCVCNDGFVQKGSVCVPIGQCGCVDENGHKHQFDEEWYTSHCRQKCECEEEDGVGEIECDDEDGCDDDAVCLPNQEGDYYCQPTGFGDCTITRDSKYSTFDELKYGFEGEHSYVLVRSKNLPQNFQDVYVEGIYAQIHDGDDSSEEERDRRDSDEDDDEEEDSNEQDGRHRLRELKIRVYNHTVEFKKNRGLVVDGRNIKPPVSPSACLKIYQRSSRIYLKSDFGLLVKFDGHGAAEITLPRIYRRKVGGLCGNFDQQRHNDWMKPDGTLARNVREFGASWRV
eukprot:XP_011614710.1 PREDICTED: zonadhesin-like isoform X2 [Takifugu rubripes]